jgi:anhydro-N-acetylmuramic acid kinase
MRIMGMISGTSLDGIDAAIVDFTVVGDRLTATIEAAATIPYPERLQRELIGALPPAPVDFARVCRLDTGVGQAFAAAAARMLADRSPEAGPVDAICTHGQTVYHWVEEGKALGTLQIGQPAWIAESTGLPVVSDVRAADVAAGGEGAPLVPILDRLLLQPYVLSGRVAGALNLGGISNVTRCAPDEAPRAWDIGPANALIDAVVTAAPECSDTFDRDGRLAAAGRIDETLLDLLLTEPYYALPAPKSSGKELFNLAYVRDAVDRAGTTPSLPDLVATLTELTAQTVAASVRDAGIEVLVASGGGVRNPVLMGRIRAQLPEIGVLDTTAVHVPVDGKEAVAFALIGWATLHGLPANVPSCTGATGPRVLGRVTPGAGGAFALQMPLASWPQTVIFSDSDSEIS